MVLDELRSPYLFCTPGTFPQYHTLFHHIHNTTKILSLNDWKSIRTVCWKWKILAGEKPYFFIYWIGKSADAPVPKGASSVFMFNFLSPALALERIAHLGETLTTLVYHHYFGSNDGFINELMDNSSTLLNLKCLALSSTNTRKSFWKTLQEDFPNLVSLTILSKPNRGRGRYVLRRLEILDIHDWEGFQLVCPSLKHLAIKPGNSVEVYKFVVEHGHQLESFIAPEWPPRFRVVPADFWSTTFPNIITLGRPATGRPINCPSDHPLRHFLLTSVHQGTLLEHMLSEIDSFPQIRSVHIQTKDLLVDVVNEFRRRCEEKGIQIVEIVNGEIECVPLSRLKAALWWLPLHW
ncbi:hypothetical protein FRC17_009714 [Serendipita sp. 399]|nr:hypothetical protein FRC17_009714 [Serendipita sp. 399]